MQVIKIQNPFNLADSEVFCCLKPNLTISEIAEETGMHKLQMPFVCFVNGFPILREFWNTPMQDNDHLVFLALPQGGGGGGSNPVRIVALVALVVATVYTGGAVGAAYGSVWGGVAAAGVAMGGSMLVNALIPPPKPSLNGMSNSLSAAQSPTYSLQAQGNQARLGNPIPVIYGRHLVYPDFASQPYYEYIDNNQYVYQLHVIGQGEYEIDKIMIEDTPISSFAEINYEILSPNTRTTLFREDVVTSTEVSGQELLQNKIIGPFVLNPAETKVNQIGIDIAFQRGLYYANDSGSMSNKTINWKIEACLINDDDEEIGDWFVLGNETLTSNSHNAIFKTYNYSIVEGRYLIRATRLDVKDTSSRAGHEIRLASAKGFVVSDFDYGNVTMLAMKMKATDNLSQRSSRMVNCIVTRKLPIWTGSEWTEPQSTRSIAWALADVLKAKYGAKLDDSRIDLNALSQLNQVWEQRGDNFNAIFDSKLTVYEALSRIAKCGRAVAFLQGGIVRFVRDEPKTIPMALFSPRNIVKDSLSIQYLMPSEDTADSVTIEYFSEKTWKSNEVTGILPDSTSEKPATVELFGCTNKAQALREAEYMAAANRYRRRIVTFSTELEGLIPTYGDLIAITHDMAKWGQGGEIVSINENILGLSEPVSFTSEQAYYIALRKGNGSLSGPYRVEVGSLSDEVVLLETPDFEIYTGTARERTHFAFGSMDKWAAKARIIGVKPRTETVEITAVIEDERVHIN